MNLAKRPSNVPEENILDLRSPKNGEAEEQSKKTRSKPAGHVDFLSLVEKSENALSDKIKSWFVRAPKTVETPTLKSEPAEPIIKSKPVEFNSEIPSKKRIISIEDSGTGSKKRVPYAKVGGFAVGLAVIALAVFGARFLGKAEKAKGDVLGTSTEAVNRLVNASNAAKSLQFGITKKELQAAQDAFLAAQQDLEKIAGSLKNLPGLGQVKSADNLLKAGQAITSASTYLATGAEELSATGGVQTSFIKVLDQFDKSLNPAIQQLQNAAQFLKQVNPNDLPQDIQPVFAEVQSQLPSLSLQFSQLSKVGGFLKAFLGAGDQTRRYIFAFQNNNELRPTGGFLGSLAIVDIFNGQIDKIDVPSGGIYDFSGQTSLKVIAPKPLQLVQANWNLQDANWSPDFPTSSKKILEFYNSASTSVRVDGIVAITPAVLQSFLKLTGPVEVPEVGETFTAENMVTKLQTVIKDLEKKDYSKPKLVLGYLAPKILARAFSLDQTKLWEMLALMQDHLIKRDIQFFFIDPLVQKQAVELGWAGEVKKTDQDFLMINRANLGGGKTDGVIEEMDNHSASIASDGAVIDTVTIIRKHNGVKGDKFTQDRNVEYVRFYVPLGSKLISASGFERIDPKRFMAPMPDRLPDPDIQKLDTGAFTDENSGTKVSEELGYTVFGNWLAVGPGGTVKATISYSLPFKLKVGGLLNKTDEYSLLIQKQPGTMPAFTSTLTAPENWQSFWEGSTSNVFVKEGNTWRMSADLAHDEYYAVVLK
ncbi:MAG: hypothetical protein COT26_01840 [Candidatus Kerfeldbacteria bacterium CG08_land_8_20_14_0_20_43_14]|uniref:DUF4012 domain-containing protein n=1 Tax=Candidatus Kerfeldbacteria bacterium CG08_land_8_20_14_0_20_43_14 TaxID=2014246 RepID=A0A2H0YQE8_9BACT|nr:MAG: hypothetical protein COT26_01840 [Candidatus Kerfeldbacteria bacterium CG08_land_8_20_14_0_20_43_14]